MTILLVGLVLNYIPRLFPKWRKDNSKNVQTVVICCDVLGLLLTGTGVLVLGLANVLLVVLMSALMLVVLVVGIVVLRRVRKGHNSEENHPRPPRSPLEVAAIGAMCVGGAGVVLLVVGLAAVWGTGWGINMFAPAATLMAAGLASFVALKSVVTWNEQRRRERDQTELKHREEVYEAIVIHMTNIFDVTPAASTPDAGNKTEPTKSADKTDRENRAKAALWADNTTLGALADWQDMTIRIMREQDGNTGVLREPLMTCFYEVVAAMRENLSATDRSTQPDRELLLSSIFNDRPPRKPRADIAEAAAADEA
ncbi:hypothetical protein [Paenarthrobacter ureafaciens]|uniref:hypothetical protein n=1 Tax=Paenarthrobacter ureafaciens TaxID=37931 RepID=UPI002DBB57BB|nr:hypothetical protein [Paenarthrobacter ureafaciens]